MITPKSTVTIPETVRDRFLVPLRGSEEFQHSGAKAWQVGDHIAAQCLEASGLIARPNDETGYALLNLEDSLVDGDPSANIPFGFVNPTRREWIGLVNGICGSITGSLDLLKASRLGRAMKYW